MRIWMHPYLPRRNLRIVIHRCGSLSCAWRPTDSELHRWPVDSTSGNVKLLLPPRQSRGNSHYGLDIPTWTRPPYSSITPNGDNWLGRVDGRIVAGARSGNELFFGWTA